MHTHLHINTPFNDWVVLLTLVVEVFADATLDMWCTDTVVDIASCWLTVALTIGVAVELTVALAVELTVALAVELTVALAVELTVALAVALAVALMILLAVLIVSEIMIGAIMGVGDEVLKAFKISK